MKRKTAVILSLVLAAGLVGTVITLGAAAGAGPVLPGITSTDDRPNGCIDCHNKSSSTPGLLNAGLKSIKGHPDITKIVKKVPDGCAACHKGGAGKTPSIADVVHQVHYQNPSKNAFVTSFGGSCLNCHTLALDTGAMSVKTGAANW